MRIFVTGAGRCGTVTFSKACSHITNFTSGHESHNGQVGNFDYPDNHIEVDARLAFAVPYLKDYYSDSLIVVIYREAKSHIKSLSKRNSLSHFAKFHFGKVIKNDYEETAKVYHQMTYSLLSGLSDHDLFLEDMKKEDWKFFWETIKAEGDYDKALKEWDTKYNESK